jgi:hypothetical protein
MKEIFNNELATVKLAKAENLAVLAWKETCGNIVDEQEAGYFDDIRALLLKIAPDKLLADMSACDYLLTADSGSLRENPIFAMYADLPPSRIALVIPKNLFVNAFFDAARAYETIDANKELQYFKDAEKAMDWLK